MASASFPAWATSLPKRDLTSTIAPGKEWDKPDFPAGPPSAILIATGWNNDIMNPSEDSLTRSSLAFNIWARVDTSQPGNHLFFCVTRIRTTCSFSLPTAQPTGPVARIGTWDWYSETTFQLAWNDLKDHVLPCREYRISNAARGAHRCFNANTSIINHPNRMVIVFGLAGRRRVMMSRTGLDGKQPVRMRMNLNLSEFLMVDGIVRYGYLKSQHHKKFCGIFKAIEISLAWRSSMRQKVLGMVGYKETKTNDLSFWHVLLQGPYLGNSFINFLLGTNA
ncbi:hypothetical protein K469DRAFT_696097 [Zopfia rhizophila CBS 207.26]|uniref:Uncharacterized protein n=1 Tax=Zopfia rhizophila CBS 207.26 TaxID=1314779 RepID=A0A6A6EK89_9PEZI|nr:hypothetical protein K469DRAFT_696097 [Zopfia rhizophila CBS 207.26]